MKRLLLLLALVCPIAANSQAIRNKRVTPVNALLTSAVRETSVSQLPIRRVILYSNGVSYIERRGMVSGNAEINLSFKQSQVDDVLKSMVVLDLGQFNPIAAEKILRTIRKEFLTSSVFADIH
ncbi:MAG: hypothetical protein ABI999_04960 [Acidobacteriota bacterium]